MGLIADWSSVEIKNSPWVLKTDGAFKVRSWPCLPLCTGREERLPTQYLT
jgi:hypothetical protein